jgi:hypothetical protein
LPDIPTFSEYIGTLGRITAPADPTAGRPEATVIREAAASLDAIGEITLDAITDWVAAHPSWGNVLGLAVGLSQEKMKNNLKHHFNTQSWAKVGRERPGELVAMLDDEFSLISLLDSQRNREYEFGDILVARAGTRLNAVNAAISGRLVEDKIEAIVSDLGLPYETRTRFIGRNGRDAPCDIVIPKGKTALIAIAAKGFDSTGSKLSAAFKEIEDMANVRQPRQFIMAVVDGIGWKSRLADLRRLYQLWEQHDIDGMYTLSTLDRFRADLQEAAQLRHLI